MPDNTNGRPLILVLMDEPLAAWLSRISPTLSSTCEGVEAAERWTVDTRLLRGIADALQHSSGRSLTAAEQTAWRRILPFVRIRRFLWVTAFIEQHNAGFIVSLLGDRSDDGLNEADHQAQERVIRERLRFAARTRILERVLAPERLALVMDAMSRDGHGGDGDGDGDQES